MSTMIRSRRPWLTTQALAAIVAAVCGPAWAGTLQGTATYRERIALPPDAVFEAVLQDVSRADAPASVLGRATVEPAGQPPFRFEITYDDAVVQPGRRYAVRATVTHQGRLLFTTGRAYPVLDGRNAPLDMLLVSARRRPRPGPMADGIGPLPAPYAGELPGASGPIAWHLDLLPASRDQLRTTYVGKPEPNRIDDIGRWTRMAGTMMACPSGMDVEQRFLPSLEKVERWRIKGSHLEMLDGAGAVLARFEAVALR